MDRLVNNEEKNPFILADPFYACQFQIRNRMENRFTEIMMYDLIGVTNVCAFASIRLKYFSQENYLKRLSSLFEQQGLMTDKLAFVLIVCPNIVPAVLDRLPSTHWTAKQGLQISYGTERLCDEIQINKIDDTIWSWWKNNSCNN